MTTAVASPPNLQSLPRLGWNGGNTGGFSAMSSEDVSRIFMPQRKTVQRSNSSTSLASTASASSTASTATTTDASSTANGEPGSTAAKKKTRGGFWPVSKAESTSGVSAARANGSVQPASLLSGKAPTQPAIPSVGTKQNGLRVSNGNVSSEATALLALLPMNGTFERKQINVPFTPETMRVGRQTNAKTVPTPSNGYFDSKVLSRQHAEVWADREGRVWIRDVKSSNGTFVNGQRLSLENRESEPHQLRQHDTLELGIDIVSEDQKTIVHHKVSAKVEFVGLPGASNNVLDLSFGDLDPSHGSSLLPSPLASPLMQQRSRTGPSLVTGRSAPSSIAGGGQLSAAAQNRQINLWGPPLSVEHLVKQISHEMRAAKQQASDLDHIERAFSDIMSPTKISEPVQEAPSPVDDNNSKQAKPRSLRSDNAARFSEPPAPPPQQPLPEKPDSAKSTMNPLSITKNFLKRSDTAKAASPAIAQSKNEHGLTNDQSALLEAVKRDLDSQRARVKQLEDLLQEEKHARVRAEERAQRFEQDFSSKPVTEIEEPPVVLPPPDSLELSPQETFKDEPTPVDGSESRLQQRLDNMVLEMQKMKTDMDRYQKRAETAEADASKSRESLSQMIERLRQENEAEASSARDVDPATTESIKASSAEPDAVAVNSLTRGQKIGQPAANGHIATPKLPAPLQQAVATALRHGSSGDREVLMQSAPYVSALGVVLIGIGMMAYLNSWQKTDR